MPNIKPTKQEILLIKALEKRGVEVVFQYWDGYKHVDLFIPRAKLYIEIDGLQHYNEPHQFMSDLTRDHYLSDGNFFTKHISNQLIETHLDGIADTIAFIAKERSNK